MLTPREPWLGLATTGGLITMLLGDGLVDVAGFVVAVVPFVWGGVALARARAARAPR